MKRTFTGNSYIIHFNYSGLLYNLYDDQWYNTIEQQEYPNLLIPNNVSNNIDHDQVQNIMNGINIMNI